MRLSNDHPVAAAAVEKNRRLAAPGLGSTDCDRLPERESDHHQVMDRLGAPDHFPEPGLVRPDPHLAIESVTSMVQMVLEQIAKVQIELERTVPLVQHF